MQPAWHLYQSPTQSLGVRLFRGSFSGKKLPLNPVHNIGGIRKLEERIMVFPKPGN